MKPHVASKTGLRPVLPRAEPKACAAAQVKFHFDS